MLSKSIIKEKQLTPKLLWVYNDLLKPLSMSWNFYMFRILDSLQKSNTDCGRIYPRYCYIFSHVVRIYCGSNHWYFYWRWHLPLRWLPGIFINAVQKLLKENGTKENVYLLDRVMTSRCLPLTVHSSLHPQEAQIWRHCEELIIKI